MMLQKYDFKIFKEETRIPKLCRTLAVGPHSTTTRNTRSCPGIMARSIFCPTATDHHLDHRFLFLVLGCHTTIIILVLVISGNTTSSSVISLEQKEKWDQSCISSALNHSEPMFLGEQNMENMLDLCRTSAKTCHLAYEIQRFARHRLPTAASDLAIP